jgi:glycosyltransferase involved in cell wall biosynthesis
MLDPFPPTRVLHRSAPPPEVDVYRGLRSRESRREEVLERPSATVHPIRVLLTISNLEYGGAQRQVVELANGLNARGIEAHVCCLSDYVPLARFIEHRPCCPHVVEKRHKFDLTVVPRLAALIRSLGVNIIHAFLFDAEIAGRLARGLAGSVAFVGSERNTNYASKWRHTAALRVTGHYVDALVANSHSGKYFQIRTFGVPDERIFVVHNGVDTQRFAPQMREGLRTRLGVPPSAPVVGMVASFKRQKNHAMFFRMARRVLKRFPQTRFLCAGAQLHGGLQRSGDYAREMAEAIQVMGLFDRVLLLGNRDDLPDLYNACDVTVLTSQREGTPNVLLESMACGVPVVATDVSDNAIVAPDGQVGYIVPYDDDVAMAEHVMQLLGDEALRHRLGCAGREWVQERFSIPALVAKTCDVYRRVLGR